MSRQQGLRGEPAYPTPAEAEVAKALDDLGVEHISQYQPEGCPYTYSEFIPPNVLIDVRPSPRFSRRRARRQADRRARWAVEHGFKLPLSEVNELT